MKKDQKRNKRKKNTKQRERERIEKGCGVDVDKDNLWCCGYTVKSRKITYFEEKFVNSPLGIEQMRVWLVKHGITHLACEGTGVYWFPMHDRLYDQFEVIVGNAAHMAKMAGYKTDRSDGEWIANLLLNGAIQRSFIPRPQQRELRSHTRLYRKLVEDRTRVMNRITGLFREAGITTDSVITGWFKTKSGQWMIEEIIAGKPATEVVEVVHHSLNKKKPQLVQSLDALPLPKQLFENLCHLWDQYQFLSDKIEQKWSQAVDAARPFEKAVELLKGIGGIGEVVAITAIAEFGDDMSRFPSARHLASWAGLCPGNNESGGKRRGGKIRHGNKYLRGIMLQAARSSIKPVDSPFRDYFNSMKGRIGDKKAAVALAHKLLRIMYAVLRDGDGYSAELVRVRSKRSWRVKKQLRGISDNELLGDLERRPGMIEIILQKHGHLAVPTLDS